ncbi:MAG: CotH kinase family protein [Eubacteriales bacterium]|nr:CotH kinase family protein [Eubacteriales bacterium]
MKIEYEKYLESLNEFKESVIQQKEMPIVHISTLKKEAIVSKHKYVQSVIDVFNCNSKYELSAEAEVKVRGNSTQQGTDKPYRIKFTKKQGLLGLHNEKEYKSWVLLKTYDNLLTDYQGFRLAKEIFDGKYYASDSCFVNVYVNQDFKGVYLLCEQNQAGSGRVDIYEPKDNESANKIGYLIEIDNTDDKEHPSFEVKHKYDIVKDIIGQSKYFQNKTYIIKSDITNDEQTKFISKYVNNVFEIIFRAIYENKKLKFDENYDLIDESDDDVTIEQIVSNVIDIESVINMVILYELVKDMDLGCGSFYLAIDFSDSSIYKKLTLTAPWDFGWTCEGKADDGYFASIFLSRYDGMNQTNPWLVPFMTCEWFRDKLKNKWQKLYESRKLSDVTFNALKEASKLQNDLGKEYLKKYDGAKKIIAFVNERIELLNHVWGRDAFIKDENFK